MQRAVDRLASESFDVLVVGSGIYGAAIAWDATDRGLKVALIDRGDFGGATSANSAKTLHGGVRALQRGDLVELRRFVRERRALARIAPHLVAPLPFVIPATRHWKRHRILLGLYFALYDLAARDRNRRLDPAVHLPPSRRLSRRECLDLHPLVDPAEVTGGVLWHDSQMYSPDRLTLAFVLSAAEAGAAVANYVEAHDVRLDNGRVRGVAATDRLTGAKLDLRTRIIVNATGPWAGAFVDRLLPGAGRQLVPHLVGALNVGTRPLVTEAAVAGAADGRLLFAAPWRHVTILGTGYTTLGPEDFARDRPAAVAVDRFLADVRRAFPRALVGMEDIKLIHYGLLPATADRAGEIRLRTRSTVRDHTRDGAAGLVSVVGVRYTTARHTAQHVVDRLFALLGRPTPPCRTHERPLVGGGMARLDELFAEAEQTSGLPSSSAVRIVRSYGTRYRRVVAALTAGPNEAAPLGPGCAVTRGEIRYAVREEMAVHLADAVLRRTDTGSAGHPGREVLRAAAVVMGEELGWSAARIDAEVDDVERSYRWIET